MYIGHGVCADVYLTLVCHIDMCLFPLFKQQLPIEISHPNKYGVPLLDLTSDREVPIIDSSILDVLSSNQVAVERVILKTFIHHQCNVIVTDRLRACLLQNFGAWEK